ncbi:hypothetical protein GQ44DRAFT_717250 [Phaeosphaeriaceae sp. PMI808]|nr:hypothetical protein GQ44DRAFT_717250 [Phaeosphaeriaceae sp. PMI808]
MNDSPWNMPEDSGWNPHLSRDSFQSMENQAAEALRHSELYASDTGQYGRQRLTTIEEEVSRIEPSHIALPCSVCEVEFMGTTALAFHLRESHQTTIERQKAIVRPTASRYPILSCSVCGGEFTGKYAKGNLARHKRVKHGQILGELGRALSTSYHRGDAKRKHEWKKHRLQDVKPNKRKYRVRYSFGEAIL